MDNASPHPIVYSQDLALDPPEYLVGPPDHVSSLLIPFAPPPSGVIRLFLPLPVPDDPYTARVQQVGCDWVRDQTQQALLARDYQALVAQQQQFARLTCILVWQRGFDRFITTPTGQAWGREFARQGVLDTAERLYERHGDVRLRIDLASLEFDLCGPSTRVRQSSDDITVSLRPVVDALSVAGLWLEKPDVGFRDLARVMVQLGRDEHQRVGGAEFTSRWSRGPQ